MPRHWIFPVLEEATDKDGTSSSVWSSISRAAKFVSESDDYFFRTNRAESLNSEIEDLTGIQDLAYCLAKVSNHYQFKYGSIFLLSAGRSGSIWKYRVCTSLPSRWFKVYNEKRLHAVDPILNQSLIATEPNFVTQKVSDSPLTETFWREASRHSIGKTAYCGSYLLESGATVGFSFLSDDGDALCRKRIYLDECDLHVLIKRMIDVFEDLAANGQHECSALSEYELHFLRQVLYCGELKDPIIINGYKVCPKIIQAAIKRKLGVENVFQAVAIASARGWFDDLSYTNSDIKIAFEEVPSISHDDVNSK